MQSSFVFLGSCTASLAEIGASLIFLTVAMGEMPSGCIQFPGYWKCYMFKYVWI